MDIQLSNCQYCGEQVREEAVKCRHCGEFLDEDLRQARLEESSLSNHAGLFRGIAAVLSTVWPGLGQIFQGRLGLGIAIMMVIIVLTVFAAKTTPFMLAVTAVAWLANIFDAYNFGLISPTVSTTVQQNYESREAN